MQSGGPGWCSVNITSTAWGSGSKKKSGEIGRIEEVGENKIWRAFETGTASSLWCFRKLAGLPPCPGCGNWDVGSIESGAWKGPESKSLGPVPHTVLSHPENYCGHIDHCKKGNFADYLDKQWLWPVEELGGNKAQSLESSSVLVFFREGGHIMHREVSHDSYQIVLDTASSLSHSESLPWSCHEAVLSPERLKTSSSWQLWASFS